MINFFIADSSVHSIIIKERSNIGYDLSGYFESQENLDYYRNYAGPGFLKTTENLVAYLVYRETKTQYESLFNCKLPVV